MKAKTQMRIGILGVVAFLVLRICLRWPSDFEEFVMLFCASFFFALYIYGILGKRLAIAKVIYICWWILTVFGLIAILVNGLVETERRPDEIKAFLLEFLFFVLLFGLLIFFMRMGLKGLKRIMEAEGKLKIVKDIPTRKKLKDIFLPNQKFEEKHRELIEIINLPDSGELIDWDGSKVDTGQVERFKRLRQLALDLGASHISTTPQKTANEGELVVGIQAALQTATMLNACKAATTAWIVALFCAFASMLSAIAAWVAICNN